MYRLSVFDEIITQKAPTFAMSLNFDTVTMTAKEILQKRIEQDCQSANVENEQTYQAELARLQAKQPRQIVEPSDHEKLLNGEKTGKFFEIALAKKVKLDWQTEFDNAVKAFAENGFLLFIDDEQIMDLEQRVQIKADNTSKITFIRLIPLQGG